MSQTFKSWQEYVGQANVMGAPAAETPARGFSSWQDYQAGAVNPLAPAPTQPATVWDQLRLTPSRLPDDHARRMKDATRFAPESQERLMALADTAVVGFPTFGEERYNYPGRDMLLELTRFRGPSLAAALPGAIRQVATDFGEEPSIVEARLQTLGLSTQEAAAQEMVSGRVFTDMVGLAAGEQALPIARQGALLATQRLMGTYDPDTFEEGVSEMEQRIAEDGNQRALQMAANLGLYILPIGPKTGPLKILSGRPQSVAGVTNPLQNPNIFGGLEAVRFMGRVAEEGVGGAVVGELQDMGTALNPLAEDLAPSERVARVALSVMALAGLTSGAVEVRGLAREITSEVASRVPGERGAALQQRLRPNALASVMQDALGRSGLDMPGMRLERGGYRAEPVVDFAAMTPAQHLTLRRNFELAMDDMPARDLVAWSSLTQPFEATAKVDPSSVRLLQMLNDGDLPEAGSLAEAPTLADAATLAEQRLAESGLVVNEQYVHLDELKAQTAHLPRLTYAQAVTSSKDVERILMDSWGLDAKAAKLNAAVFEARAQAWADDTGRPVSEWYTTRIASMGAEGDAAGRADGLLVTGAPVQFQMDGQYFQGKLAPNQAYTLGRYGRIRVTMDDGTEMIVPLAQVTEGIPDQVRERFGNIESAKALYQAEEAPALLATHSTSVEGLQAALDLGGIPAPSVAITKAEGVPKYYGKVAMLFDTETVDPLKNPEHLLVAGDGYTVTQPRQQVKVIPEKARALDARLARWGAGRRTIEEHWQKPQKWPDPIENWVGQVTGIDEPHRWRREYLVSQLGYDEATVRAMKSGDLAVAANWYGPEFEQWYRRQLMDATDGQKYVLTKGGLVPYTMEAVLDVMKAKRGTAKADMNDEGLGPARAKTLKPVPKIEQVVRQSDRLADDSVVTRYLTDLSMEIDDIQREINDVMGWHPYRGRGEKWRDDALKIVVQMAKGVAPQTAIERAGFGGRLSASIKTELEQAARKLAEAPVQYFEAKPYRPVKLDEVRAVVAPNDMDAELVAALQERGVKVYQYDAANESDRARVMTQAAEETGVLFQREQTAKAKIMFDRTGKAMLRALKNPDASTALHELGHILRRDLYRDGGISAQEQAVLETWAGVKDGKWHEAAEEKFARAWERYLREGKAPVKELRGLFQRLKNMLQTVYAEITGSAIDVEISPEVRDIFDNLLGKKGYEERARLQAEEQAAVTQLARQRDELLAIMPDDPRLDVFGDVYDEPLASAILREFGNGTDDPRLAADVLIEAQNAAYWADLQRQADEDFRATYFEDALEFRRWYGKGGNRARWYREGNKYRSDARPSQLIGFLDARQMPPQILEAVTDWGRRFFNDPDYLVDRDNPNATGQPVRPRTLTEIMDEGEVIPAPIYDAWLESIRPPDYDDTPLYQDGAATFWEEVVGKALAQAKTNPVAVRTATVQSYYTRPDSIRAKADGTGIQVREGKNWVTLTKEQEEMVAAQVGMTPPPGHAEYVARIQGEQRGARLAREQEQRRKAEADRIGKLTTLRDRLAAIIAAGVDENGRKVAPKVMREVQSDVARLTAEIDEAQRAADDQGNNPNEPNVLYQSGPSEADLALVAAKRIAEGNAEETVLKILKRDFKQKPGRAAIIYRRAQEVLARHDIDQTYRETSSRAAVAEMLAERHPNIPKSRYPIVIREALATVGEQEMAAIRAAVDAQFDTTVPDRAAPVAEALLRGDKERAKELVANTAQDARHRQRVLAAAREQVATAVATNEWGAMPSMDHIAGLLEKRLDVSPARALELTRDALDRAGIDYEAELRRQSQRWLEAELEPAVEMTWQLMEQGNDFESAYSMMQFGRPARKESVRLRIREREAWPQIAEVFDQTSSYREVRMMLAEQYPEIPAYRYREVFTEALAANGIGVATAPLVRVDPITKRKEVVPGQIRVVIGANEVVVPQSVIKDMEFFKDRHPGLGSFWDEARYVERMTNRNEAAYKWLVEHREEAATNLTKDMVRWREELQRVYGKHAKDREFRELVMDWVENKQAREDGLLTEGVEFKGQIIEDIRELIRRQRPNDWQDIERIAEWHRATYDLLLDKQNEVRRMFGLGEIPRRADYMAHIMEEATALQKILQMQDDHSAGPGAWRPTSARRKSPFNRHALQRKGQRSRRDSLANTEDYIESALRTIHLTAPAIRRRTLAKVLADNDQHAAFGDVVQYWQNQANRLTNQQVEGADGIPRVLNGWVARSIIEAIRWTSKRTALNGLVGNLRTAVMQTGSLPQVTAIAGPKNVAAAAVVRMQVARGLTPDPVMASAFMTRRYAYKGRLARSGWDRAIEIGAKPMEIIEKAVAEHVWTSFHVQAIRLGRPNEAAVKYADRMTNRALAGRAIGEKPAVFDTDYGKVLLQFQLEVNNMVLLARHDATWNELLGREATAAEKWRRAAIYTVSAYIANSLYYEAFSDRPLPDPIDLSMDVVGIAADNKDKAAKDRAAKMVGRVAGEIISSVPGGTMAVGIFFDEYADIGGTGMTREELLGRTPAGMYAGTLPTSSALRNATKGSTMTELGWNLTTTLGLPFGGRQLNKTSTAVEALANGGTVTDRQGRPRYTIDEWVDEARALLFGPNATKAAQRYYDQKAGGKD